VPQVHGAYADPVVRVTLDGPLEVVQDKPLVIAPPEPLKIDPKTTIKVEPSPALTNGSGGDAKTHAGEVIRREVTVFSNVKHGTGAVVTGWRYPDGGGRVPVDQYCYYTTQVVGHSSNRVDMPRRLDHSG
jgi:hypothetical protein